MIYATKFHHHLLFDKKNLKLNQEDPTKKRINTGSHVLERKLRQPKVSLTIQRSSRPMP